MNISYKELKTIEKNKFASLHSNFHKLINTIQKYENSDTTIRNTELIYRFMEVNELIDKLNSSIIYLKEDILIEELEEKYLTKKNKKKIKEIDNDNKAIKTFLPLILMYRTLLD